jgi:hypothetical protein
MSAVVVDDKPKAKVFREKIGNKEFELREERLDVLNDVSLWPSNPRLLPHLADSGGVQSEDSLENFLRSTNGYAPLAKSIADIGQMEPIYAWKREDQKKFLVLEGATRVTILRDLARKQLGKPTEGTNRYVTAKILPPEFSEEERVILLARIHVRGSGVRSWGRYIEAQFVHEAVVGKNGQSPLMTSQQLADHMGKSISWVSRLKDAYEFSQKFIEHDDGNQAHQMALDQFSVLEEIAKSPKVGPMVKDYTNPEYDGLRSDVFNMVRNKVFKEYRDARFMKQYYEDPEKWEILKQGEENSAHQLANELKAGSTSLKGKIQALPGQIERALERDQASVSDDDVECLKKAVQIAESYQNPGVQQFRLRLKAFTDAMAGAALNDIKAILPDDVEGFEEALGDFRHRLEKHKSWT